MFNCKLYRLPFLTAAVAFLLGFSQFSLADWRLNEDNSVLYYVTSKAAAVSELNSFTQLSGTIDTQGNVAVSISLASVDTAVDIRNERMRDIVFQIASYPLASINVAAEGDMLMDMNPGQTVHSSYMAEVSLRGMQQKIAVDVNITKLQENGLLVSLAKPLIVNAASFGLADSVEQLREIAGLPSINNNVVVDFTLQFDATN